MSDQYSTSDICPNTTTEQPLMQFEVSDDSDNSETFSETNEERKNYNIRSVIWNERFQTLMDAIYEESNDTNEEKQEMVAYYTELLNLVKDFINVATMYGKIIISEKFLPPSEKTIQPENVGGIAGGYKFIKQGILFKFVVDAHGLYGSDEKAMKAGVHELKGLIGFRQAYISEIHLPLMCVIDHRGFRVVAVSLLPISGKTLVYGSHDAGKNIVQDDEHVIGLVKQAATKLKLKEHVCINEKGVEYNLYTPVDIEVHRGFDNRVYILDFGRVFPPEAPELRLKPRIYSYILKQKESDKEEKSQRFKQEKYSRIFYNLLRPEFVRKYKQALSSDAFSGFGIHNSKEHNKEIEEATLHLKRVVIPDFAQSLSNMYGDKDMQFVSVDGKHNPMGYSDWNSLQMQKVVKKNWIAKLKKTLVLEIHRAGINLRHLGLIRSEVDNPEVKRLLLLEMVARVIKNKLREKWREELKKSDTPSGEAFVRVAVKYLNLVLGNSEHSKLFWQFEVKKEINERFEGALDEKEFSVKNEIQKPDFLIELFSRLEDMLGLSLTPPCKKFSTYPEWFQRPHPLDPMDIVSTKKRVKTMNFVSFIEGILYLKYATNIKNKNQMRWTLESAMDKFVDSLKFVPGGCKELYYLSTCYYKLAKLEEYHAQAIWYLDMAYNLLKYVRETEKNDANAMLLLGKVLFHLGILKNNPNILKMGKREIKTFLVTLNSKISNKKLFYAAYRVNAKIYFSLSEKHEQEPIQKKYDKRAIEYALKGTEQNPKGATCHFLFAKYVFLTGGCEDTIMFHRCLDSLLMAHTSDRNKAEIFFLWGQILFMRAKKMQNVDVSLLLEVVFKFEHGIEHSMEVDGVECGKGVGGIPPEALEALKSCTQMLFATSNETVDPTAELMIKKAKYFKQVIIKMDPRFGKLYEVRQFDKSDFKIIRELPFMGTHLKRTVVERQDTTPAGTLWYLDQVGDGTHYYLRSALSHKVLTVEHNMEGDSIAQFTKNEDDSQQFRLIPQSQGTGTQFLIKNKKFSKELDTCFLGSAPDKPAVCLADSGGLWELRSMKPMAEQIDLIQSNVQYQIQTAKEGRALFVESGSTAERVKLQGTRNHQRISSFTSKLTHTIHRTEMVMTECLPSATYAQKQRFANEIYHLSNLGGENTGIAEFYGMVGTSAYLVEAVTYGKVDSYLSPLEHIPWPLVISIAAQVADVICYLHSQNVIHNLLLPFCWILTDNFKVKISSFDLATGVMDTQMKTIHVHYAAPETLETGHCSFRSDIYTFGIALWMMGTQGCRSPYYGITDELTVLKMKETSEIPIPNTWPTMYQNIVKKCLSRDPRERSEPHHLCEQLRVLEENNSRTFAPLFLEKPHIKSVSVSPQSPQSSSQVLKRERSIPKVTGVNIQTIQKIFQSEKK